MFVATQVLLLVIAILQVYHSLKLVWSYDSKHLNLFSSPAESLYLPGMKPLHDVKLEDVPEEAKLKTIKLVSC